MPIPFLIHPVLIHIQQIDQDETLYDDEFREPIQQSTRLPTVIVPGQVEWDLYRAVRAGRCGPQEDSQGYVLFRYADLAIVDYTLKREDKFIKIGNIVTDVYVTSFKPEGGYSDIGGFTLVKAFFSDKQPSRQTRGI